MTPAPAQSVIAQDTKQTDQPFGDRNRNLPRCLKAAILEAVKRAQREEAWMRRQEVLRDAKHRLYDMNIQHCILRNGSWLAAVPGAIYSNANTGAKEQYGDYIDDYNIFTQNLLIQRAKLTESAPGIDFSPCNPKDPNDIESANAAEAMKVDFDRNNDSAEVRQSIIYHYQMGGRAVSWTRTADGTFAPSRRGMNNRSGKCTVYGALESKVPLMANCREKFWYAIVYEDLYVRNAKTDYPWIAKGLTNGPCLVEGEYERTARLTILRGAASSESQLQSADATAELVTEGNVWLRPSAFEEEDKAYSDDNGEMEEITTQDEDVNGDTESVTRAKTVREKMEEIYPDGVHAVVIGQSYCESWNESMDERVAVSNAYIGKGQARMPIATPLVVIQDRFNNGENKIAEYEDFGDGSRWFFGSKPEFDAIVKQKSQPGAFRHGGELASGESAKDVMYEEESLEAPKTVMEQNQFLFGAFVQFVLGVPPSVWGQQMPDQQTKGGYELASAQATGILGVFWMKMVWHMANIYMHNCLAIMDDSEYPDEIAVTVKGKNTIVRKESLTKGNFRACPDTDSGFPESTSAKRQAMERFGEVIAQTPLAMQFFAEPDNIAEIARTYGVPELTLPEAEARDKQLREIEELLSASPVLSPQIAALLNPPQAIEGQPQQPSADIATILEAIKAATDQLAQQAEIQHAAAIMQASQTGGVAPPPPPPPDPSSIARSSIKVMPSDFHVYEAAKCRSWLSTSECYMELTVGRPIPGEDAAGLAPNVAGVLNVVLHWMEHLMWATKEAPPPSGPLPVKPGAPAPMSAPQPAQAGAAGAVLPVGM